MEDIIGVRVVDRDEGERGFMTWGRLFGALEEQSLLDAVRTFASRCGLHAIESVEVCFSLQALAHHPYFYEALFRFAREPAPSDVEGWLRDKRERVRAGRDIFFLGRPHDDGAPSPESP